MITAIIIDDEKHCIDRLTSLVTTYCRQSIHLLPGAQTIEEGVKLMREHEPQLIFLDVEINDKTGFDLLQQVSTMNFEVIFTTAYESYALQAIKVSALDYLLKPIHPDNLKEAVEKLKIKISKEEVSKKIDMLFLNLDNANKHIGIPTKDGLDYILEDEMVRCEASGNYTNIYLHKIEKPKMVTKTLKDIEELLSKKKFFRVHHSHLVNLSYVKSYNKAKGVAIMNDGSEIEVSIRRKDDFIARLTGKG